MVKINSDNKVVSHKRKVKSKYEIVTYDWKEEPSDLFKKALNKLGIYMYNIPYFSGSDAFGFIFSRSRFTREKIKQIDDMITMRG